LVFVAIWGGKIAGLAWDIEPTTLDFGSQSAAYEA